MAYAPVVLQSAKQPKWSDRHPLLLLVLAVILAVAVATGISYWITDGAVFFDIKGIFAGWLWLPLGWLW